MPDETQPKRVSLWSVLNKYWSLFVWVLVVFLIVWTALFATAYDFEKRADGDDQMTGAAPFRQEVKAAIALVFMKDYASYTIPVIMIVAITFALLMDGKESFQMTITRWLRQKADEEQYELGREEGRTAGMAEGISTANQAWSDWYRRSQEAKKNNEQFDEPPPEL